MFEKLYPKVKNLKHCLTHYLDIESDIILKINNKPTIKSIFIILKVKRLILFLTFFSNGIANSYLKVKEIAHN